VSRQAPKPTRIAPVDLVCPACAAELIGLCQVGDAAVCIACRALITLDVEYHSEDGATGPVAVVDRAWLRRPTDAEERAWLTDPRVLAVIDLAARHHARHGSPHPNLRPPDDSGDRHPPY